MSKTQEVGIAHLMGGKRNKTRQIAEQFGISENKFTEEKLINVEEMVKLNSKTINTSSFEKKKIYSLSLENSTIFKLEIIENMIKDGGISRKGGLRSKLIDFIVENYYEDIVKEIKGDVDE